MVGVTFWGGVDLASVAIWGFWAFFAGLVYYLQTENMREGYPLEKDEGGPAANQGPFPVPEPKTWTLPHGRGERTVPDGLPEARDYTGILEKQSKAEGQPFIPVGDPMADGVGPASWAPRRDVPELDGKGHPKIVPMAKLEAFGVSAGRDPRGMPAISGDGVTVGTISDMWIDEPEQLVRYIEIELSGDYGSGKRLMPIQLTRIHTDGVKIHALYAHQFAGIPQTKSATEVTLLEEDKITGYAAGGKLYASAGRLDPQL
ncbi:MAG: photosynthetic reaction center subunit H [Pseudomonadota bacterium]